MKCPYRDCIICCMYCCDGWNTYSHRSLHTHSSQKRRGNSTSSRFRAKKEEDWPGECVSRNGETFFFLPSTTPLTNRIGERKKQKWKRLNLLCQRSEHDPCLRRRAVPLCELKEKETVEGHRAVFKEMRHEFFCQRQQ